MYLGETIIALGVFVIVFTLHWIHTDDESA
jgi:hypothetical protein